MTGLPDGGVGRVEDIVSALVGGVEVGRPGVLACVEHRSARRLRGARGARAGLVVAGRAGEVRLAARAR